MKSGMLLVAMLLMGVQSMACLDGESFETLGQERCERINRDFSVGIVAHSNRDGSISLSAWDGFQMSMRFNGTIGLLLFNQATMDSICKNYVGVEYSARVNHSKHGENQPNMGRTQGLIVTHQVYQLRRSEDGQLIDKLVQSKNDPAAIVRVTCELAN